MWTRRTFMKAGAGTCAFGMASAGVRLSCAAIPSDKRFIVVILRGGLDGLAAVPPHGDPDYAAVRGSLALGKTGTGAVIDLDGFFGLHPSLRNLGEMWRDKELAVFHTIATPYRDRSHFDAQNVLETGGLQAHALRDGWLNRALPPLDLDKGSGALAIASSPPLLLDGEARVTSWMPSRMPEADEEFLSRVRQLYGRDPVLSAALKGALATRATLVAARNEASAPAARTGAGPDGGIVSLMQAAGDILAAPGGPRVAVFDISGWDTHFNQGAGEGQLARRLLALDAGLAALRKALGLIWRSTAIVAVSEFGRTAAVNGTGGTDHGTGGVAFLFGGAVNGGRVHADWTGLKAAALKDGRDLPARIDMRALFKGVLGDHLGLARAALEGKVFPDSGTVAAIKDLFRA